MSKKLNCFITLIMTFLSSSTIVIAYEEPDDEICKKREICKLNMKKFCNSDTPELIDCAKGAIFNYRDNGTAPNYIDEYFQNVIFPNTRYSDIQCILDFCSNKDSDSCILGLLKFPETENVFKFAFYKKELNLDEINVYERLYLEHITESINYVKESTDDVITLPPFEYCQTYDFNKPKVTFVEI